MVKRPGAHGARQAEDPGGERDAPVPAPAGVAQERVLVRVTDGDVETKKTPPLRPGSARALSSTLRRSPRRRAAHRRHVPGQLQSATRAGEGRLPAVARSGEGPPRVLFYSRGPAQILGHLREDTPGAMGEVMPGGDQRGWRARHAVHHEMKSGRRRARNISPPNRSIQALTSRRFASRAGRTAPNCARPLPTGRGARRCSCSWLPTRTSVTE